TAPEQWSLPQQKSSLYYLKGIVENIFSVCGVASMPESYEEEIVYWKRGKETFAKAFRVSEDVLKQFDIKQEVFYAEIEIATLAAAAEKSKTKHQEITKYPAMRRDLALVLDKTVEYQSVQAVTKAQKLKSLADFGLFDLFESDKIGADKKSFALSYIFQDN